MSRRPGAFEAIGAAVLFGAATPFASRLVGTATPQVLAGLLYLGSGTVLALSMVVWRTRQASALTRSDVAPLSGAIFFGGGLGPLLLFLGLARTSSATASLLLNLEVVFTALLAWLVFHDRFTPRVGTGLALIVAGAVIVSWQPGGMEGAWGAAAIAGACLCWALDNNLTQRVAAKDPRQITMLKGLVAGSVNLLLGLAVGGALPPTATALATMGVGVLGYGVSLMLFVMALRHLGAARTGGIFAIAPFVGGLVAVVGFGEPLRTAMIPAGVLMALGAWLQITERAITPAAVRLPDPGAAGARGRRSRRQPQR